MTEYCLDTSGIIDAWVRSYPQDAFPTFWTNVDCMIGNGSLICPDEVLNELEKQADDLHEWAKQRPALFYPIDEELQLAVQRVLGEFPRLVDTKRFRHQADVRGQDKVSTSGQVRYPSVAMKSTHPRMR